jgi:hypothetical protein
VTGIARGDTDCRGGWAVDRPSIVRVWNNIAEAAVLTKKSSPFVTLPAVGIASVMKFISDASVAPNPRKVQGVAPQTSALDRMAHSAAQATSRIVR